MNRASRIPAVLIYLIPVAGWLYVLLFQLKNPLAVYHLKQSIGLALFLVAVTAGWVVTGWVIAWIPYLFIFSIALFALVIAAYGFGAVAWIVGLIYALSARPAPLPLVGGWASRLPIR